MNDAPNIGPIEIQTFGKFSISCGDVRLSDDSARTKKVWLLIQYLIANRQSDISNDRIISDIWEGDESDDPLNVLKNLVYRARTILKKLCPDQKVDFILYGQNTYGWNRALPCTVDVEKFQEQVRLAENASGDEDAVLHYMVAFDLYQGEFLPRSAYADWVIARNTTFSSVFLSAVEKACPILKRLERADEMVALCEKAASFYPLEERVHKQLLRAYMATGRYSKAIHHYNYISELFYKELGVCLSDDIRGLYREIITGISSVEMDLSAICEDLQESSAIQGAYFCDYEVFRNLYRVQARSISRTGQSINIVLMTLTGLNGDLLPDEKTLKRAIKDLRETVVKDLRRGDVVSAFSASQLVLMLPMTNFEQAQLVCGRLLQKFGRQHRREDVLIKVNIRPLTPSD